MKLKSKYSESVCEWIHLIKLWHEVQAAHIKAVKIRDEQFKRLKSLTGCNAEFGNFDAMDGILKKELAEAILRDEKP